ncbi:adenosylcobinamide amidohydrolase [Actinocatenispora thailandica]|uniref:Adenosylcobinamide amidohydrolase n=1 Tax=Actinocatenispora thailandica TaxID=227318 RepID=A0A7R7DUY7_9ACTN|nr:adenosylcobinamide amidohydrolase [Actinocatenispora thailandica]BCJ38322.1 adenosylcobinamide amidohydrolase [Actinocatenispora thailandica]
MDPRLLARTERNRSIPLLVWTFDAPRLCISSGPLGGGITVRDWLVNATVPLGYDRTDPDRHLAEIGTGLGLTGTGAGLLTAVDVSRHHVAVDGGVHATGTVGLSSPAWAAAPDGHFRREVPAGARPVAFAEYQTVEYRPPEPYRPGTINVVVSLPVKLSPAALVNAVVTATEAKTQALYEAGVRATGTASDAVVVHCPTDGGSEPYGGPRSPWGARLARAVHSAVLTGTRAWIADPGGAVPAWQ